MPKVPKPLQIGGILALAALGIAAYSLITAAPQAFLRTYRISSTSMENTLEPGDQILAGRASKQGPKRGDIVIAISAIHRNEVFIKRVAGLAGDRIRIVSRVLYRNGAAQAEPYAKFILPQPEPQLDNFPVDGSRLILDRAREALSRNTRDGEFVVPPGHVFLLGDNRENALDDRFTGPTPAADIVGKALFVYAGTGGDIARRIFRPLNR